MQLKFTSQRAQTKDRSVICWLIFVQPASATGRAAQDGRAGACCSCPSLVAAARGSAQPSALRVIEIYQGLIRPFQRLGKTYELRCGQLYARTIAASADRR